MATHQEIEAARAAIDEIRAIRDEIRDQFFKAESNPKAKDRNVWRNYTKMLAAASDYGVETVVGVDVVPIMQCLEWHKNLQWRLGD